MPSRYFGEFLQGRIGESLLRAAKVLTGRETRIDFAVDPAAARDWEEGPPPVSTPEPPAPKEDDDYAPASAQAGTAAAIAAPAASTSDRLPKQPALPCEPGDYLAEANFLRLPFALLWDKEARRRDSIVVEDRVVRSGVEQVRSWTVAGGKRFGLPGPAARGTFRALEKVILDRTLRKGMALTNPQGFDLAEILRSLRLSPHEMNYKRVAKHLLQLQAVSIVDEGLLKEKKGSKSPGRLGKTRGDAFHIIDRLVWRNDPLPDGTVARQNHVWFGEPYLESVNAGYVKLIDWDRWMTLGRHPLAQRLYEVLGLRFFGLKNSPYAVFDYPLWCQLMPVHPQQYVSRAKQCSEPAHEALHREGVLERVEWVTDTLPWQIRYYPTARYLQQLRADPDPELNLLALELANELDDRRSLPLYQLIVVKVDRDYIQAARAEVRMKRQEGKLKNPGAYFNRTLQRILTSIGLPVPFGRNIVSPR